MRVRPVLPVGALAVRDKDRVEDLDERRAGVVVDHERLHALRVHRLHRTLDGFHVLPLVAGEDQLTERDHGFFAFFGFAGGFGCSGTVGGTTP